jgi:uncharacterized membrane protein YeiH
MSEMNGILSNFLGCISSVLMALMISRGLGTSLTDGLSISKVIIFAISGSVIALYKVGKWRTLYICLSGLATALGGGAICDLISLKYPFLLQYPQYIVISIMIGLMIACFGNVDKKALHTIDGADWVALGCLAVVGAEKAISIGTGAGIGAIGFIAFFAAFLTGAGGGLVRDLFLLNRPPVAVASCYGLSAALGGLFYCHLATVNIVYPEINWLIVVFFVFAINFFTKTYRIALH